MTAALAILRGAAGLGDRPDVYAYGTLRPIVEALVSRPHFVRRPAEARAFLERHDFARTEAEVNRTLAERRRSGEPAPTRIELLEIRLGEALDAAFAAADASAPLAGGGNPTTMMGETAATVERVPAVAAAPDNVRSLMKPEPDRAERHAAHPLFVDRRRSQCAWPLWDERTPQGERRCCGAPVHPDAKVPYCREHQKQSGGAGSLSEREAARKMLAAVTKERSHAGA